MVIGAGVSGLSAAYFLPGKGFKRSTEIRSRVVPRHGARTPWLGFDTPWRLACAVGETKTTELLTLCQENSALARTLLPTQPVTWIWANHGTMVEDEWTPSLDVLLKNNVHASRFTSRDGTLRGIQLPEQWTIDPTDGLHTLEKHCRSHDVNICRGIRANDVSIDPLGTVVCTNRGTIRADAVSL